MQKHTQNFVSVNWLGQNIAPFLYGYSSRILKPGKGYIEWNDRIALRQALLNINPSDRLYDVRLSPVTQVQDFVVGHRYLALEHKGYAYSKTIIEVTWTGDRNGSPGVEYKCVWPSWDIEGYGGFSPSYYLDDEYGERIVLRYRGRLPEEDHSESFFAKMMSFAQRFWVLEDIWSFIDPVKLSGNRTDAPWWPDDFSSMHPAFRRSVYDVYNIMHDVYEHNSIHGINRIYDDRYGFRQPKDEITPILEEMQKDILHALWNHPEIAEQLFSDQFLNYWGRYIDALFENYNIGKAVAIRENTAGDEVSEAPEVPKKIRALQAILEILRRKDTTNPGYYQAALFHYQRLTGKTYTA